MKYNLKAKTKVCTKCKQRKNKKEDFFKSSASRDGFGCYCKKCSVATSKKHRADNLERYQEKEKQYRTENFGKIKKYHETYYSKPKIKKKTREYQKEYRKTHKEDLLDNSRRWYENNKELCRARALQRYYDNHNQILAKRRARYKKKK